MKKVQHLLLILICTILLAACGAPVPEQVSDAFNAMYPDAKDVEWEMEDELWEVEFELNDSEAEASFDLQGNWLETETDISRNELPDVISNSVSKFFPEYTIREAARIEDTEMVGYELELLTNGPLIDSIPVYHPDNQDSLIRYSLVKKARTLEILLSIDGKLLSKKAIDDEEEQDEDETDD